MLAQGVARPRANKLARLARACKGGVTPAMPKNGTKEYYESLRCPAGQSRPPVWTFKVVKGADLPACYQPKCALDGGSSESSARQKILAYVYQYTHDHSSCALTT